MTNVNPKSQREETPKAPQRSSSVGKVFSRLFSKSPNANEPRSASENSPNANPAPLMDSYESCPQASTRLAGPRGRTPPKHRVTTIRVDDQQPEETSTLTSSQQQQYGGLLTASGNPQSSTSYPAMAMPHRGGHPVTGEGEGWLAQLRPAQHVRARAGSSAGFDRRSGGNGGFDTHFQMGENLVIT